MTRIEYLRYQIERVRRFAATLTDVEDRERFQGAADDYQREIDALSSTDDATSADMSAPSDAIAASGESDTAAPSDASQHRMTATLLRQPSTRGHKRRIDCLGSVQSLQGLSDRSCRAQRL
jgi:hypothetical protein